MSTSARLRKHSVSIRGHATSYTLEDPFFKIIEEIAAARNMTVAALVAEIDSRRERTINLSSALRLHVLDWLKSKLPESNSCPREKRAALPSYRQGCASGETGGGSRF